MRFKNTRDILDHVSRFHDEVSAYCGRVAGETDRKRLGMLLEYIGERQKDLARAVSEFTEETSDQVLDTWFQYTSDDAPIRRLLSTGLRPDTTLDDLLHLALQIADYFISLYRDIVDAADTDELRQIFQNLLDREEKEKQKLARNFQLLIDI